MTARIPITTKYVKKVPRGAPQNNLSVATKAIAKIITSDSIKNANSAGSAMEKLYGGAMPKYFAIRPDEAAVSVGLVSLVELILILVILN
jgi:hypothetical protein